jgi:SAM-dependent methyltransferase
MLKMAGFRDAYLMAFAATPLTILDVGAQDVAPAAGEASAHRRVFARPPWRYVGLDVAAGANVDVVVADAYAWNEVAAASADVVISGQALEHIERFWLTVREIDRVLKPGGLVCLVAPSRGPEHRFPVDCWRFYPDGFRALAGVAGWCVLEAGTDWPHIAAGEGCEIWGDTMLVAQKPGGSAIPALAPADALARARAMAPRRPLSRRMRLAWSQLRGAARSLIG